MSARLNRRSGIRDSKTRNAKAGFQPPAFGKCEGEISQQTPINKILMLNALFLAKARAPFVR